MSYILVIWTVVGFQTNYIAARDWRPIGDFRNLTACEAAAAHLGAKPGAWRCVPKG